MKRFLLIFLAAACLTTAFCPVFAAVECTVPRELSDGTATPDVPMLSGVPEETAPTDTTVQEIATNNTGHGLLPVIAAAVILCGVVLAIKAARGSTIS